MRTWFRQFWLLLPLVQVCPEFQFMVFGPKRSNDERMRGTEALAGPALASRIPEPGFSLSSALPDWEAAVAEAAVQMALWRARCWELGTQGCRPSSESLKKSSPSKSLT